MRTFGRSNGSYFEDTYVFTIHRTLTLPATLSPDAIYIVKDPKTPALAGIYFTGKTASVVAHTPLTDDIEVLAQKLIDANGKGILPADVLPPPEEHTGELYMLNGRNIPCWSNGEVWIDLSANTSGSSGEVLDTAVLRRLRDKADFGISLI